MNSAARWSWFFGAWLILWLGSAQGATTQQPTILVFGDSLSASYGILQEQGWVSLLQERLKQRELPHQVVNASVSGETTDGGLRRLTSVLERHNPSLVILELGGNDGLRGFPLKVIERNLNQMIEAIQAAEAQVLLVGMRIPPNYGTRYTEGFHGLYQRLAQDKAIALVPFMLEQVAVKPELMQDDRIHPRAEAQPLILDNIWPHLKPLL